LSLNWARVNWWKTRTPSLTTNEIGEMASAMDNLVNGLKGTTLFAENIGKGSYATTLNR
jgi:hypothetical protein